MKKIKFKEHQKKIKKEIKNYLHKHQQNNLLMDNKIQYMVQERVLLILRIFKKQKELKKTKKKFQKFLKNRIKVNQIKEKKKKEFIAITKIMFKQLDKIIINNHKIIIFLNNHLMLIEQNLIL